MMINNDCKFIMTRDMETAAILTKCGFQMVGSDNNTYWKFLNDDNKKIIFANLKDLVFTNVLFG